MNKSHYLLFATIALFISSCFCGCSNLKWKKNKITELDSTLIRQTIYENYVRNTHYTAWDSAIYTYYKKGGDLLWLSPAGKVRQRIFLQWLKKIDKHGINPNAVGLKQILVTKEKLQELRGDNEYIRNIISARLEYLLSRAYLRYICGLDYGFVNPAPIYNHLYEDITAYPDTVTPPPDRKKKMFRLFVIPLKQPTSQYAINYLELFKDNILEPFKRVQPSTLYYHKLQIELQRVRHERKKRICVRANLERARWKYKQAMGKKYVFVNTAAFLLKAVDEVKDTLFDMKICCGSFKHKTPLMTASLNYCELNPNWIVPPKIIRKEIIPIFARDSSYFARNKLRVYNKQGQQLNPRRIDWSKYENSGIPFKVIQDSGDGSDLGRIIFRFPNRFSVYLHDTSSKGVFNYSNRSVSHGCIRLERPLDLAYFLLGYPNEEKMDNIRLSVGQEPKTEKGKELKKSEMYKNKRFYGFQHAVPLFIDYRTLYLGVDGSLHYCDDHYGYDKPLVNSLAHL